MQPEKWGCSEQQQPLHASIHLRFLDELATFRLLDPNPNCSQEPFVPRYPTAILNFNSFF
jgi:hypothetical protein